MPQISQHAQHVLGVEIVFMLDEAHALLRAAHMHQIPVLEQRKCTSSAASCKLAAMLLPRGAELYALYTDTQNGLFVRTASYPGFFCLQEQWRQLALVLPKDSVCRAVVYRDKADKLIFGVYDMLRVQGVDQTHLPVIERHKQVHALFKKQAVDAVSPHWVGEEGCLVQHVKNKQFCDSLPFDIDYMLRMHEDGEREVYRQVLKPLHLP